MYLRQRSGCSKKFFFSKISETVIGSPDKETFFQMKIYFKLIKSINAQVRKFCIQ